MCRLIFLLTCVGKCATLYQRRFVRVLFLCKFLGKECITMAKSANRNAITLACTVCKNRNYRTNKNKKNDPDRIELSKYCKFCKKHTPHKETK